MGNLIVSEQFFSIQGEGRTQGVPAVFLRLGGCNLKCGYDEGTSTWKCDTWDVWHNSKKQAFWEILDFWEKQKWIEYLREGAHLVITGGEPCLYQEDLLDFLETMNTRFDIYPEVEVETNGTLEVSTLFTDAVSIFNVSPKLSNSGIEKSKRINDLFLDWFVGNASQISEKAIFKFVVTTEEDWDEIKRDFIDPHKIPNNQIWLMPGAESKEELGVNIQKVVELCVKQNVNFSNRIHIQTWDRRKGV